MLLAMLAVCPRWCDLCSYEGAKDRTECNICNKGYGVVEHNKTCAGDHTEIVVYVIVIMIS